MKNIFIINDINDKYLTKENIMSNNYDCQCEYCKKDFLKGTELYTYKKESVKEEEFKKITGLFSTMNSEEKDPIAHFLEISLVFLVIIYIILCFMFIAGLIYEYLGKIL